MYEFKKTEDIVVYGTNYRDDVSFNGPLVVVALVVVDPQTISLCIRY